MSRQPGMGRFTAALLVGAALALAACSPINQGGDASVGASGSGGAPGTTNLSIATGGTGGVYYPLGNGLAT